MFWICIFWVLVSLELDAIAFLFKYFGSILPVGGDGEC